MAATFTRSWETVFGDVRFGYGYVTHDGSDTTVLLPLGTCDMAFVLPQCGTNSTGTTVSVSGHTVTFSAAGVSGRTDYLIYVGV